jgi:murein DD-endopeptidase MepM/ murein hydrolase activator NlpD
MGSHRADRRGRSRRPSVSSTPRAAGKRIATPPAKRADASAKRVAEAPAKRVAEAPAKRVAAAPAKRVATEAPATAIAHAAAGRRKASRHSSQRGSMFRGLPSAPIVMGIAALAVSAGGAVTAANPAIMGVANNDAHVNQASALGGDTGEASTSLLDRKAAVSRDTRRDALADAATQELVEQAEAQAQERNAALAKFAKQAEAQAAKLALNLWVLPVPSVSITAEFGEYGLWASYHTGIDFNGSDGDPIHAIAAGEVTSASYDGSYGNKTVITLDDGTEIWYCHQSAFDVSVGDVVDQGDLIGYVGSTGHVTGSHLHVEVRPGGGDPVDPRPAFAVHGVDLP